MFIEKKVPILMICESHRFQTLSLVVNAEFHFASQDLDDALKAIWFNLVCNWTSHPESSCILSYQYLADRVAQSV